MSKDKTFAVPLKRRREGRTDYSRRISLVRAKKARIVVRKTNRQIIAHAVKFNPKGDETLAYASSMDLDEYGFYGTNNTPSAYLTGYLLGKKMNEKEAILDIGRRSPTHGGVVFACLKGLLDAGINIPHDKVALPSEDRINGKVLDKYAKEHADKFSNYEKKGIKVGEIEKAFIKAKSAIDKVKA